MIEEPLIRIEDVLNGKYRFVEGHPVRRSYVDEDINSLKMNKGEINSPKNITYNNTKRDNSELI